MITKRLKEIHLTFENCEGVTIPGECVNCLDIRGITKSGSGSNLWYKNGHGWYDETERASDVKIGIVKSFLENSFVDLTKKVSDITIGERIKKWNDVTWVSITNKRYWGFWFINPFKAIKYLFKKVSGENLRVRSMSQSYFKFRITNEKYVYSIAWYCGGNEPDETYLDSEGKKRYTSYSNKYQTILEDVEDDTLYIVVREDDKK